MTAVVTTYLSAEAFLATAQPYLEEAEALNGLMLGLAFRLQQFPARIRTSPYLATVADDSGLQAVALMTPPHNLLVYSARDDYDGALQALLEDLHADEWPVVGVLGPEPMAHRFAVLWSQRFAVPFRTGMQQRVFELRRVIWPATPAMGNLRLATTADLSVVTEWVKRFSEEALEEKMRSVDAREMANGRIRHKEIYLWQVEGQIVSMAARSRPTTHGVTINSVYTPRAWRRQGYASHCVAALSQLLLDEGYTFCTLFTNLANPTSNHIYQALGYRAVADFTNYIFERSGTM